MKQIRACTWGGALVISLLAGLLLSDISHAANAKNVVARVASSQGGVQVKRKGQIQWIPVVLNDTFNEGDVIRVQSQSRAAIILLGNETIIRLDQNTTITLSGIKKKKTSLLDLFKGAVHFISRVPRTLKVNTPHVNATVEGTEFVINVLPDRTFVTVFEGRVLAQNNMGSLALTTNQSAVAITGQAPKLRIILRPRDAVQWALYYPTVLYYQPSDFTDSNKTSWQASLRRSIRFFRKGDISNAFDSIKDLGKGINDPRFFNYRATLLLSVGRVDEAISNIDQALKLSLGNSQSLALKSIISLAQNNKGVALVLAEKAIEANPYSAAALVALSYVYQASFDIDNSLRNIQEVVKLEPGNALAWARLAELWLAKRYLDKAVKAAKEAVALNPNLARTQTVLGFAYLTKIKTRDSKNAFEKAIKLDQADSLPRLGLGLAKIREGDLKEGRVEIEIAASLDPNNSIIRSYLGKAYFEEKRDKLSKDQFAIAKELDPHDPTPWFYDAIRKQTVNRPVEALHDIQKSIELNENRAVYRSKLLLDEDLAARSASRARIYKDLGFQQLALIEGWKSSNTDPSNYSAHRFLADSYSALPRHDIARVSELLQSQLLQPINITPIQPQLAESNLFILEGSGPSDTSFNEYNPLFNRNRLAVQASGVIADKDTQGNDFVQSGVLGKVSYSLGQFHYETDGFRENNDLKKDIYNAFFQTSLSYKTSVQAEYRYADTTEGDLPLRFDPDNFRPTLGLERQIDTVRLGFRHSFTPHSNLIASFMYQNSDAVTDNFTVLPLSPPLNGTIELDLEDHRDEDGWMGEIRHLFRSQSGRFYVTGGIGRFNSELKDVLSTKRTIIIPPLSPSVTPERRPLDFDIRHTNFYLYSQINFPKNITWTIGGSVDFFEGKGRKNDQVNPKFGFSWDILPGTTLRAALFRTMKRRFISDQTIEPTQVAGFNQFFDDLNGSEAWRYGVAVDQKFSGTLYGGAEYSRRDTEQAFVEREIGGGTRFRRLSSDEDLIRTYFYWTPHSWLALSAEYQYEWFERDTTLLGEESFNKLKTHRVPLGINFFHPSGFSARVKATYFDQEGDFGDPLTGGTFVVQGDDNFWYFDGSISYRLPKRWGIISVGAKNIFNKNINFQDTDPANPAIYPEQLIFARFTLSY